MSLPARKITSFVTRRWRGVKKPLPEPERTVKSELSTGICRRALRRRIALHLHCDRRVAEGTSIA
jgi:hypothetical protein